MATKPVKPKPAPLSPPRTKTASIEPEQAFADQAVARDIARVFCDELIRHGTTTALVFCSVHAGSVDALFAEAKKRNLRLIAGKVLMDRNAPAALTDTARSGYDQSKALIATWHGRGRCLYAITPRFAVTSTPEQLELAGSLWREHPEVFVQTHIAENKAEIVSIAKHLPQRIEPSSFTALSQAVFQDKAVEVQRLIAAGFVSEALSLVDSLEPAGGSTSGVPTGPILFTGNIVESVPTTPRPCSSPPGTTPTDCTARPPSPPCAGSTPWKPPPAKPAVAG